MYIHNSNWTEQSPIQSVIMQLMAKSDNQEAGVQFINHGYDYWRNWMTQSPVTN